VLEQIKMENQKQITMGENLEKGSRLVMPHYHKIGGKEQ